MSNDKELLAADIARLEKVFKNLKRTLRNKKKELGQYGNKEQKVKKGGQIKVTANAIVRYLQVVEGMDIQAIKEKIIPVNGSSNSNYMRNGLFDKDDFTIVIANNNVVNLFKRNKK